MKTQSQRTRISHAAIPGAALLMLAVLGPLLLAGCSRSYSVVRDETAPPRATPAVDMRRVAVSGEVLTLPTEAAAPNQLLEGRLLTEGDVQTLEAATPGSQVYFRPRMIAPNGDTGRFRLGITGQTSFIAIEMTPKITADGKVSLRLKIDATSADGTVDTLGSDRLFQPDSGIYQTFGPLRFDGRKAYVVLKAGVRAN